MCVYGYLLIKKPSSMTVLGLLQSFFCTWDLLPCNSGRFEVGAVLCWTLYAVGAKSIIDCICYEWNNLDVSGKWENEEWGTTNECFMPHISMQQFPSFHHSGVLSCCTWCVFCAAGFRKPSPIRLRTQYHCLLWSQNDAVGHISHFMSVMWKHNVINLKAGGNVQKDLFR